MRLVRIACTAPLCAVAVLTMASGAPSPAAARGAAPAATFTRNVRADIAEPKDGQNEPQVAVDQSGMTYVTWQSSSVYGGAGGASRTADGIHFTDLKSPDATQDDSNTTRSDTGDVAITTTTWPNSTRDVPAGPAGESGVFWSILGTTTCGPINLRASTSRDQGASWAATDATCQPLQVDRNWIAAYTEPQYRGTPQAVDHTWVYQEYHDFGVSNIWVTTSADGGKTWDGVTQHSAIQPGTATFANACNTVPGGIAVDQRGAHAGRVYVVWDTGDASSNLAEGCNYTQAEGFTHLFLSYSDDHGQTWTSRLVANDPCSPAPPQPSTTPTACQDMSEIFTPLAVDDAGNVYVAFVSHWLRPEAPEYDIAVAWSTDGGDTWSGGSPGMPGTPRRVNTDLGTHYFPWITAGGNGGVDVVWYGTPYIEKPGFNNKPAGAPGSAEWNVYMGQSLDLPHGAPFTQSHVSDHAIYFGDICTTGIFCGAAPAAFGWGNDRILLDDFGVAIGPDGGARIAWTDTRDSWNSGCHPGGSDDSGVSCQKQHLYFACQKSGVGLHGETVTGCGRSAAGGHGHASTGASGATRATTNAGGATGGATTVTTAVQPDAAADAAPALAPARAPMSWTAGAAVPAAALLLVPILATLLRGLRRRGSRSGS